MFLSVFVGFTKSRPRYYAPPPKGVVGQSAQLCDISDITYVIFEISHGCALYAIYRLEKIKEKPRRHWIILKSSYMDLLKL